MAAGRQAPFMSCSLQPAAHGTCPLTSMLCPAYASKQTPLAEYKQQLLALSPIRPLPMLQRPADPRDALLLTCTASLKAEWCAVHYDTRVLLYCMQSVQQFARVHILPARHTAVCPPCPVLHLVVEHAAQRLGPADLDSLKVWSGPGQQGWVAGRACWAGSSFRPASTALLALHCSSLSAQCWQISFQAKLCTARPQQRVSCGCAHACAAWLCAIAQCADCAAGAAAFGSSGAMHDA